MVLAETVSVASPARRWIQAASLLVLSILLAAPHCFGWIYPEHRDITLRAIQRLDPERRAVLDRLWTDARTGYESRLSLIPADVAQGRNTTTIDYAAWPAIGGDHSCSATNMLETILDSPWILEVADVAAELKAGLAEGTTRSRRINALRDSDIKLQRVDPDYATRAGSNNVHFLLPRQSVGTDARSYLVACFQEGVELNAIATYAYYHYRALVKAARLSRDSLTAAERTALARSALADEAFGLHFLEDTFSSGHVAGTWGDASQRKGTHDYYSEHGMVTRTWSGEEIILTGDAWMRVEDSERASWQVAKSLGQVLDAAAGKIPVEAGATAESAPASPDTFNVCTNARHFAWRGDSAVVPLLTSVLRETPVPALASGLGQLPRFRAELGPFLGFAPAMFGFGLSGGFGPGQTNATGSGGISLSLRLGMGLEGVMNESGDGLVFLDIGMRLDGPTLASVESRPELAKFGALAAVVPSRQAYTARLRLPFWLIPGDLLIAGPVLLLVSPGTLTTMAVQAGSGGLIPWQAGISTFLGRFQFVLGREVGVAFFGYRDQSDRMVIPTPGSGVNGATLTGVRSIQFEFPIVEYLPFRTFALDQSSSIVAQLIGGFDTPTRSEVIFPEGAPAPELKTNWFVGLRLAFDWRSYLGVKEGGHR